MLMAAALSALGRRALKLMDLALTDLTLLCIAACMMCPRPATTRTGVPRAKAQGLMAGCKLVHHIQDVEDQG